MKQDGSRIKEISSCTHYNLARLVSLFVHLLCG